MSEPVESHYQTQAELQTVFSSLVAEHWLPGCPGSKLTPRLVVEPGLNTGPDARVAECELDTGIVRLDLAYGFLARQLDVQDTMLHELAHLLSQDESHGPGWQEMAERLDCSGEPCCSELFVAPYTLSCSSECIWFKDVDCEEEEPPQCPLCQQSCTYHNNYQKIADQLRAAGADFLL